MQTNDLPSGSVSTESARTRDALRAAHMYYIQDLTMDAIARELHTSRSTVSRLLSHARDTGLVEIRVRDNAESTDSTAQLIAQRFGVSAHIVPVPDTLSDVDRRDRVALSAARMLNDFISDSQHVGLAWGSTLRAVSTFLIPKPTRDTVIVQLNGSGNVAGGGILHAGELLQRFGEAYGARIEQFPVPAFFDDPRTRELFWQERTTQRILSLHAQLDVAIFSVGSASSEVPSQVHHAEYLEPADYAEMEREGVVGDVATVFFRADGSTGSIALNQRGTGPSFSVLRRAPRRICIASGLAKVESLRGALTAKLITDLVVDEPTALALLGKS